MFWLYLALTIIAALAFASLVLYWFVRWMGKREPYATFLRLRTRQKLTFFRLLLRDKDRRVPAYVKVIPLALVVYLAVPFDIIPDFIPVVGYLDDMGVALLALVLIIKLTPREVVLDLLEQARGDAPAVTEGPSRRAEDC